MQRAILALTTNWLSSGAPRSRNPSVLWLFTTMTRPAEAILEHLHPFSDPAGGGVTPRRAHWALLFTVHYSLIAANFITGSLIVRNIGATIETLLFWSTMDTLALLMWAHIGLLIVERSLV